MVDSAAINDMQIILKRDNNITIDRVRMLYPPGFVFAVHNARGTFGHKMLDLILFINKSSKLYTECH